MRRRGFDIEVTYSALRVRWVIRELGGVRAIFGLERTKDEAEHVAIAIAKALAHRQGTCEVFLRRLDGTWTRNTYGRDPRRSKG